MKELQADLDKMTIPALRDLKDRIHATIETKEKAERAAVIAKMHDMAAKHGLSLDDVLGAKGKRAYKRRAPSTPKYRDPKSGATWSGMGRPPAWLGKDRESFRI